jgi:hypothetical protein
MKKYKFQNWSKNSQSCLPLMWPPLHWQNSHKSLPGSGTKPVLTRIQPMSQHRNYTNFKVGVPPWYCELPLETRQHGPPPASFFRHILLWCQCCVILVRVSHLLGIVLTCLKIMTTFFCVLSRHYSMVRMFCYLIFDLVHRHFCFEFLRKIWTTFIALLTHHSSLVRLFCSGLLACFMSKNWRENYLMMNKPVRWGNYKQIHDRWSHLNQETYTANP